MNPKKIPSWLRAGIAAFVLILIGCGAASGDRTGGQGGDMREPAPHRETVPIPIIDQDRPSQWETATFAMG